MSNKIPPTNNNNDNNKKIILDIIDLSNSKISPPTSLVVRKNSDYNKEFWDKITINIDNFRKDKQNILNKKDLNEKEHDLDMKIKNITDAMKKNRKNNKKTSNLIAALDNYQLMNKSKFPNKPTILDIIRKVDEKYLNEKQENKTDTKNPFFNKPWWENNTSNLPDKNFRWGDTNKIIRPINKPDLWQPPVKIPSPPPIEYENIFIEREITGIKDILQLIEDFPLKYDVKYNINMKSIHDIKEPLNELNNMIGMHKLKDSIVDQIIYFIQGFHNTPGSSDFMHTCIYGPPGTGKTEVAKIMGKIFSNIGVLKKNTFKKVTRSDLIAGYLGQTAIKTRDVIKEALGGVLFIDEAYALGNSEKRDSFAKECIDTLCEALSDHKADLMVIIAGYEEEMEKCFFAYNSGLDSRFTWRFKTDDYKAPELNLIFQKKIKEIGWSLKQQISDQWFEKQMGYFKFFGRDIETLLAKVKIAHARRVFCKPEKEKKILTQRDIDKGMELYLSNEEVSKRKDNTFVSDMYI